MKLGGPLKGNHQVDDLNWGHSICHSQVSTSKLFDATRMPEILWRNMERPANYKANTVGFVVHWPSVGHPLCLLQKEAKRKL